MVAKKKSDWNNCCSDVIKLPILSNTYNIELPKMAEEQIYFAFSIQQAIKRHLSQSRKHTEMDFYINICNNIVSVHENFPMIASMPSCFSFEIWVWKCALYFTFLKIRPPYFFFSYNQKGAFWTCSYTSLQKSQHFVSNASSNHCSSCTRRQTLKGLQVESLKMTVFSGNGTNWLLRKALALWLNPGS